MNSLLAKEQIQQGFTLLELLLVITIIGSLAIYAIPSYNRHVNEAKSAAILTKIHTITMAYADVAATQPETYNDHKALTSSGFGSPPPYLPGLKGAFDEDHGVALASNWVNHSGVFNHTGHEAFPVLFLKANTEEGHNILRALDHVTQNEHTFVTPNMMMLALAVPHETYTQLATNQAQAPSVALNKAPPVVTPPQPKMPTQLEPPKKEVVAPPKLAYLEPPKLQPEQKVGVGGDTISGGTSTKGPVQIVQGTPSNSGDTEGSTTGSASGSSGTSSLGSGFTAYGSSGTNGGSQTYSQAAAQLNWPPGWAKHPEQHVNQNHPGHHHGNH